MSRITGAARAPQRLPDRRQPDPYDRGSRALFFLRSASAFVDGEVALDLAVTVTTQGLASPKARSVTNLTFGAKTVGTTTPPTSVNAGLLPEALLEIGFQDQPLTFASAWSNVSARLRHVGGLGSRRGRSYEFDRMETGTLRSTLDNRDAALSPENTASPYAPVRSTRPIRARFVYDTSYPAFRGISEGYPQSYLYLGKDAVVSLQANDLFYALNNSRFTLGTTTLQEALLPAPVDAVGTIPITVAATALPMPQAVPFEITLASPTEDIPDETVTVTEIVSATQYLVTRTAVGSTAHEVGTAVTTAVVNFGEAYSGTRIQQVLEAAGFSSSWYDLDTGQSLITASEDLSTTAPLEHINAVADAEFGRFFVSRAGQFTFRDRSSIILDYLTPVFTFRDGADTAAGEVPYRLEQPLAHSDEKLYNRVKITIPSGYSVDLKDQASIDQHFERVFEREYPYANSNDADSAARFVLARSSADTLRLPEIIVQGANDPARLWPLLLPREIGDRVRFRYQPVAGGSEIDKDMAIEGIAHERTADDHRVIFQCTEVDSTQYWILGLANYGELDTHTRVAF